MLEIEMIDSLSTVITDANFVLEAAQSLNSGTIQLHCLDDEPKNSTKGYEGQRKVEIVFTCYAINTAAARMLCRRLVTALREHSPSFGSYTITGWKLEGETGGFDKNTNLCYRDFTYNATYQESE